MSQFDVIIDRIPSHSSKWNGHGAVQTATRHTLCYTTADMDFACPSCVLEGMKERLSHPILGYTLPYPELVDSLCGWMKRRHSLEIQPCWVKPTTGIITGLSFSLRAVASPGDKVLCFTPVYDPFFTAIVGAGLEVEECPLCSKDGHYEMDLMAVEKALASGIRVILFCNPHNPVGRVWTEQELTDLAELCKKYDAYLISDEAHAEFALFGNRYTSVVSLSGIADHTITCLSPNKAFNIAGNGSAYLIIPSKPLMRRITQLMKNEWIQSPPILSRVAAQSGYNYADSWIDELIPYLENNSLLLRDYLEKHMPKIRVHPHEGTYLMWIECSCFGISSADLAPMIVEKCGVALQAGRNYRGDGDSHLRINIACPERVLLDGLDALLCFYRQYFHESM